VNHIGSSSLGVEITLCGPDGAERVRGKSVLVFIRAETKRAEPIPDELRARITRFYAG
jgi:acyl-CoA thioesterase FadM